MAAAVVAAVVVVGRRRRRRRMSVSRGGIGVPGVSLAFCL